MDIDDFGVDDRAALEFFRSALEETPTVQARPGQPPELPYCASILAHFSSTSTESTEGIPAPRHLLDVFDQYVLSTLAHGDADLMEDAGAKTLLLLGFFHRAMAASRHNIDWYRRLGRSFFHEAATLTDDQRRKYILTLVSRRFDLWQLAFYELEISLRHRRFLLNVDDFQDPPQS
jgi:hypothetical protein